ncbi:unnamed protein product [Polarella glacialis]|uniref:C3H1-type domain-containing protein n=1 Tax=Polarella glacialis TaxID=89957 RepID=A0A813DEA8_POLGL|nr:unnamed protein product [Polarella glacialis]
MFKKRERPQAARKTEEANEEEDETVGSANLASKKFRRNAASSSAAGAESSGIGISASTKKDVSDARLQADKAADAFLGGFKASGSVTNTPANDATRRLEVDTEVGQDNRAVLERNQKIHEGLKDGTLEAGVYRGAGAYKRYANRSEGAIAAAKYTGLLGPLRSSMTNVRSCLRIEYIGTSGEGGVCKDYKETGYCGFGDSCKFAHDRSDYKPSYILEKEWEDKQKLIEEKRRKRWEQRVQRRAKAEEEGKPIPESEDSDVSSSVSDDDEKLPTECGHCDTQWQDCKSMPIQTICGHFFCEDCAMTAYAKSAKCLKCGNATNGIFNSADTLEAKLKEKKAVLRFESVAKKERKRMKGISKRKTTVVGSFGVSLEDD